MQDGATLTGRRGIIEHDAALLRAELWSRHTVLVPASATDAAIHAISTVVADLG